MADHKAVVVVEGVPGAVIVHDHRGKSLKLSFVIWSLSLLNIPLQGWSEHERQCA